MAEKLNETEARQGRTGKPILLVLIAGVALIVVGYVLIASIGVSTSPDGSLVETQAISAPERASTQAAGDVVTTSEAKPQQNNAVSVPQ